jgi:hypothetical protein
MMPTKAGIFARSWGFGPPSFDELAARHSCSDLDQCTLFIVAAQAHRSRQSARSRFNFPEHHLAYSVRDGSLSYLRSKYRLISKRYIPTFYVVGHFRVSGTVLSVPGIQGPERDEKPL